MTKKQKLSKDSKRKETLAKQTEKMKNLLLEQLAKYPIVQVACERAGIGRATYYDWRKNDKNFMAVADKTLDEGVKFVNDLAESRLIKNIQDGNNTAIIFWLKNHHNAYNERIIHEHEYNVIPELLPEQRKQMIDALRLMGLSQAIKMDKEGLKKFLESAEVVENKKLVEEYSREKEEAAYKKEKSIEEEEEKAESTLTTREFLEQQARRGLRNK